jgi:hypothetical protein
MQLPPKPLVVEDVVEALVDPRRPATDPIIQALQVAMSGFGYNFYDARNVARSNDAIVRERASNVLGETARALAAFEQRYRARNVPPASREHPLPPDESLRRLRAIDAARKHCEALIGVFCSAETPATDSIWFRVRDEQAMLYKLIGFDVQLASGAERARAAASALDAASFDDESLGPLENELEDLGRAFEARGTLLRG